MDVNATPLADALTHAINIDTPNALGTLTSTRPAGRRDRLLTLLQIYDLHTAPIEHLGERVRFQHDPAIAAVKQGCERRWLAELRASLDDDVNAADVGEAMRAIAARDRLPAIYKWLAHDAAWRDVVAFIALEGGPDAGFDDLVAACQIGLTGPAKLELATNYWDEMGNGSSADVHTDLHQQMAAAIEMPRMERHELPSAALARSALGGLLATNRCLQPEMLGALGLTELQAGPRCRLVLQAFDRCHAPTDAYAFYRVHADVDPRHGQDWLDHAIVPLARAHPHWGPRILAGARWRERTNADFMAEVEPLLTVSSSARAHQTSGAVEPAAAHRPHRPAKVA